MQNISHPSPSGEALGSWDGSQRRYFLKDHLGSVRSTVDQNGNVDGYDDYYPFGLQMPGRSSNSANPNDQYKFTGHEDDDEAGLDIYHANARGYDPVLGRFMQMDPLLEFASPYVYVGNNPLSFTDPTGLYSVGRGGSNEFGVLNGGGVVGTPEEDQFGEFFDYEGFEQQKQDELAASESPPNHSITVNGRELNPNGFVLNNTMLIFEVIQLYLGIEEELGTDEFRFRISGGERYRGQDGQIYSSTTHRVVPNSSPNSPHLASRGARAVDLMIRNQAGTDIMFDVVNRARSRTKLIFDRRALPSRYPDRHYHLQLPNLDRYYLKDYKRYYYGVNLYGSN